MLAALRGARPDLTSRQGLPRPSRNIDGNSAFPPPRSSAHEDDGGGRHAPCLRPPEVTGGWRMGHGESSAGGDFREGPHPCSRIPTRRRCGGTNPMPRVAGDEGR